MTQQPRSTASTPTPAEDADAPPAALSAAPPVPPLAEPRPPAERRVWPRTFHDRLTAPLPGLKAFARFAREGAVRPGPEGLADIPRLPYEPGPLPRVDARTVAVTWAGHASWVVRIGGLTVLTDPVWSRRILGTPARVTPVGVPWSALPRVDAVVISHNHYDHLDAPTLRRLPRDTPVLVPAGLGRWFHRRRFTRVTELDWWEATELDGVRFDFVPAHHWSKRSLTDTCRTLWGGWVLTAPDGRRVYFAGDTGYGHWFDRIGRRYPGIDLALLPHRRLRPPLVAPGRPLRPGGGGTGRPGPRRPPDGAHALGHVRAVRGTGPGAPDPRTHRLGTRRPAPRAPVGPPRGRLPGTGVTSRQAPWAGGPTPSPAPAAAATRSARRSPAPSGRSPRPRPPTAR